MTFGLLVIILLYIVSTNICYNLLWLFICIFIQGGLTTSGAMLDTTEIYRSASGMFIEGPALDTPLSSACLIKFNETVYVLTGGKDTSNTLVRNLGT